MKVQRVFNVALLRDVIGQPALWTSVSEDNSIAFDEYYPDLESLYAIALVDDDENLRGFILGRPITDTVCEAHVAIHPDYWGDSATNVELARMGCQWILDFEDFDKLVASIPVTDKQVLRFAQRVGFKREGTNRKSFRRNGELLDQYYVGMSTSIE
jgi:RimJ/RimL family protein N-acetyltransferase